MFRPPLCARIIRNFRYAVLPPSARKFEAFRHPALQIRCESCAPPDNGSTIRLSRLLSLRSILSRREADAVLDSGDGRIVVDGVALDGGQSYVGHRVAPDARVELLSTEADVDVRRRVAILHKPRGFVTSYTFPRRNGRRGRDDKLPQNHDRRYPSGLSLLVRKNIMPTDEGTGRRVVGPEGRVGRGFAPAGRLDVDSTGLVVYTSCGVMARKIMSSGVDKEYVVSVRPLRSGGHRRDDMDVDLDVLRRGGAVLPGGSRALRPMDIEWIAGKSSEGAKLPPLRIVLREGQKRMIRRVCEEILGLKVTGLRRMRVGPINIGKLPEGQWRYAKAEEVQGLIKLDRHDREKY